MTRPLAIAIVDDEPLARRKLRRLIADAPDAGTLSVVGEAGDGPRALELLRETRPDLVFLDVEIPGGSGLDVLRRADISPAVIFTTAFEQYAVDAFELAAVDYLVKPFSRERFLLALDRVRAALAGRGTGLRPRHLARVFVRDRNDVRPMRVASIQHVETADDVVLVHAAGARFSLNMTLNELESKLDPAHFLRIHRRLLVNLDHVVTVVPLGDGRVTVHLRDGARLVASRQYSRRLRARSR